MRIPATPSETPEERESVPLGVKLLALAAGVIFAVMGLTSAIGDYRLLHKLTHLDETFHATPAKWLQVKVRHDSSGNAGDYYPDVLFEYFVDGRSVWGWRLSYEERPRPRAFWEDRLRRYRAGDTVTAYIHPDDPKESVVEKKHDGGLQRLMLKIAAGAGFFLAGLILFCVTAAGFARSAAGVVRERRLRRSAPGQ